MRAQAEPRPERSTPKRSTDDIVQARKNHLVELVGRRRGERLGVQSLGPMARAFLDLVAGPQMNKALRSETKAVPARLAQRLADELADLVAKDRFMAAPPADAKERATVLDGRAVKVVPNHGTDTHRLGGAIDLGAHVLGDVFKAFDIRSDGLTGTIADVLKVGLERRADLANPRTWLSIVPHMAAAAMAAKGPWQAKVGAAALAGVSELAAQPPESAAPARPTAPGAADAVDRASRGRRLGATEHRPAAPGASDRKPGTMAGGILGLTQARTQSGDSRKLAGAVRDFMASAREVLGDEPGLEEIAKRLSAATAKEFGGRPRLIDLSAMPAPEPVMYPEVDPKVADFANIALGPEGLNVMVVGGNEMVAANVLGVLRMATAVTEQQLQRPVDLTDPQDQAAVLRIAVDNLAEVSPTAQALSAAFEAVSTTPDAERVETLRAMRGRHHRALATTWVVEALSTRDPEAMETGRARLRTALKDVESALEAHAEAPPELANARTTLTAQRAALDAPDELLAQAVLRGGLSELQYPEDGTDPVGWARLARASFAKAEAHASSQLDLARASQTVAPEAAAALGRSSLATIWNVAAEAVGGGGGGPEGPGGPGGPRDPGDPDEPGDANGPRRPGDLDSFDVANDYAASLGARVDKRRRAEQERRQSFDDIRALLNDPSLEFFDKIFLVMTLLIDRMRDKIEKDQIDQLDREEMMWINEQLAHEYQKEVEMAQRDIHELGKEVDKSAGAFAKAERQLKQLEATPEQDRSPTHADELAAAKKVFREAKGSWADNMGRFEKRKTVLNELRDARDAHRVQIASDRRSADIFAAKVKRNTHVVEMYMDLIKTFEEHKKRNLARLLQ